MHGISILDGDAILRNLKLSVEYASEAGLLKDRTFLGTLQTAEEVQLDGKKPDLYALTVALNEILQLIAPITLSDLRFGRNPASPENNKRSRAFQLFLTLFALMVLVCVGYFMHSLRIEQDALQALTQVQEMQPQLKLTALRKMAQYDEPMAKQSTLYDEFHRRVVELRQLNSKVYSAYNDALTASFIPLFPLGDLFTRRVYSDSHAPSPANTKELSSGTLQTSITSYAVAVKEQSGVSGLPDALQTNSGSSLIGDSESGVGDFCAEETRGYFRIPRGEIAYPDWMKKVLSETIGDFCFQLKVVSPLGDGALQSQAIGQLAFVSDIRRKVSLRISWFLPFLYGLLGSAMFLMRNVVSIRTPAMEWLPIVMRLSLGGVAGIVIGWFSSAAVNIQTTSTLSLPFVLAFLTGYGIDVLFTILDRLNRSLGNGAK